ncbi:hypothetical protein DOM21_11870 [Bacteriovorax stolpii]|uniref:Uncharacterized protein n=1 Tax=Bacteriovorax stolpii TaxID=960 RepID=A0A2K9NQV7_BACTC|nr:DUF1302 family protein [Bacteriovorax stolpii]AUN97882.1 hypothetical protein C0V70_07130 [Bacteriovorax stolpii]QDK42132.1 hypothetical protein DOM21_11870 [Bacteriovorax stolpii]TDP51713.1 hypothetical protein C8D79_3158 [Bacteriovorax stolpii]
MIKKLPLALTLLSLPALASAKGEYLLRGYLSARASHYTGDANENNGQRHRAQFEQEARFGSDLVFINQLRWTYNSLYSDLSSTPASDKKDTHDIYLGENFMKLKSSSWVTQIGYQEVAWGEAFGFNYADIVNPKDLRETFYSDYSESRLPLFLVNFKYFFNNGSMQLIYSPEPRFSQNLPVNLFTKNLLQQTQIDTWKEKTPKFFKEHEYGGKFSISLGGFDTSVFYYNYLDRDATYNLVNATLDKITVAESHDRVSTAGLSMAKTLFDDFVFRTDVVYTKDKRINSIANMTLTSTPVNMMNILVSVDTPTYNKFSAVLIYAASQLSEELPDAFREKSQSYSILKLTYDLGEDKKIDLSYTHEFAQSGHAVQGLMSWPISSTLDINVGAETYWGADESQMAKIKNASNVFFGIKNYFQL